MRNTNQVTQSQVVHTLDLYFHGLPTAIACYLIPYSDGAVLIETGPGSTIPTLQAGFRANGLTEHDITDVFLTHIHLDHAGAAGWLANQGAQIHVHPAGAPHLLDPQKLLASAARIYGDLMDKLWGEFLPVSSDRIHILEKDEVVEIGSLHIQALDTPGHANHHYCYLFNKICFSGDILGVRLPGSSHIRLPMPPPEFILEQWRESLARLRVQLEHGAINKIAPTHFGIFLDAAKHFASVEKALVDVGDWIEAKLPENPSDQVLQDRFLQWIRQRSLAEGLDYGLVETYEAVNPSEMSVAGIQRYWRKYRQRT